MKIIIKYLKNTYLLLGLSLLFLLPNLLPRPKFPLVNLGHPWEEFDPHLATQLCSVSDVLRYTDSVAKAKKIGHNKIDYANQLSSVIRNRFYHGYSNYTLSENWIAAVLGSLAWSDLSAVVLPDDILKYPMAACSQQSIVMMECFRRKGINFRKIGFDHHFALEAMLNGKWYFFDTDMEPDFTKNPRTSIDSILNKKEVYLLYNHTLGPEELDYMLGNPFYGTVNSAPAPKAALFHHITKVLSRTLWLFPLGLIFHYRKKRNVGQEVKKRKFKQAA